MARQAAKGRARKEQPMAQVYVSGPVNMLRGSPKANEVRNRNRPVG